MSWHGRLHRSGLLSAGSQALRVASEKSDKMMQEMKGMRADFIQGWGSDASLDRMKDLAETAEKIQERLRKAGDKRRELVAALGGAMLAT